MVSIPGYHILEQLYNGSRTLVYRAIQALDEKPVVIKLLKNPYPNFTELVQFRNQYIIAKNLNYPGIIQTYSLENYQNGYALVMEDMGGISLKEYFTNNVETQGFASLDMAFLREFLRVAISLCDILDILYRHRIIHKDIKPANILVNPETKQVKIIDFSIASLLSKETQKLINPNVLEGTLGYISPEQTGRMNRGIDYRTDFYSLGVTFYELLTGELPFKSDDAMELVYCHIAKMPPSITKANSNSVDEDKPHPNPLLVKEREQEKEKEKEREQEKEKEKEREQEKERGEEIPSVISDIVMKLMAKNAEDRYQSALGLKYDLQICLTQLQETGKIKSFEIAQRDICDRFIIPQKLYGRENEVEQLLAAFDRVSGTSSSSEGKAELMLVSGFSGIGKTALVNEVHKPIVKLRGYFIKGKFDQFNRNIPFSALVEAFRELIKQLLTETDARLSSWKHKILQVLGVQGQVIIDVIPQLELVIGKQPPAPELSGSAAQNRFNLLFQKFIQVFTTKEHPLVILLDDLQWADSASLRLMQLLMSESESGYLLLIGAYRDNEVFPAHPLMVTLEEIRKSSATINTIALKPLSQASLNQLVADTLYCSKEIARSLTQLVYQKTKGNPFFSTQFLKWLYEDGSIKFNPLGKGGSQGGWECDITKVRALTLTDDVVEFMALRLQKLPEVTQNVLKLAACIGNQFDLATLAIVCEKSLNETATDLWKALQEGLILPQSEIYKFYLEKTQDESVSQVINYRFLHDRVQQAAYSLIAETLLGQTHFKIGQLLLQGLSQEQQIERIFDLVNQLNLGQAAIKTSEGKQQLARLNLQAGQKAKLSAAYQAAENYYTIGINLLPETAWQTNYELMYSLHRDACECAYLCGNFDRAQMLYAQTLDRAKTTLDKAAVYRVQMTQYQLQGRNSEAIAIQQKSLQLLGWEMPVEEEFIQANLDQQIATVNKFLEQQTVKSILNLPKMEDRCVAEMLRILQILFYAAWLDGQPTLAFLALVKMTTLSLQYGNSDMSPFGYVGYGLVANAMLKDAQIAYQFGQMSVELCEQFDNADVRGMTNFLFAADVHSWSRPIREADTYYNNAYKYSMEAGNWLTVGFMMMQSGSDRLTYGKNLDELYAIAETHADFYRHIKSLENLDALIVGVIQPIRNLLGLTKTNFSFDDDSFSEAEYIQKYADTPYHLSWLYSVKIRHAYLFDDKAAYANLIPQLSMIENTISSHAKVPSSVFYVALMHLALIEINSEYSQRQLHWQAVALLEEKLKLWAKACPENILHKCLLIEAEKARLNGEKVLEIMDLYEQAIAEAKANQYIYEEALANELAAKFYLDWNKEKIASCYMQEAYYCYARWGAKAKTDDLEMRYPQLLEPILQIQEISFQFNETNIQTTQKLFLNQTIQTTRSSSNVCEALDFASILKATQALSREIQLEQLTSTLLEIVIENAGAEKAALVFRQDNVLNLEAIATKDDGVKLLSIPYETSIDIPKKVVNYVKHSLKTVVLDNARIQNDFISDKYLIQQKPYSLLCTPILDRGKLIGLLYLENKLTVGAFTQQRLEVINLLCTQAAISLENARLYAQQQIALRHRQRAEAAVIQKSKDLEKALQELQQAQLQMVQNEKMATLGNLVAGVAHEVNNPIGFLKGSIGNAQEYIKDLFAHIECYQENYPTPEEEIIENAENIDLEFLTEDLPKLLNSMEVATERIKEISTSLRTFSRADTAKKIACNIHEGIDSTILILKYRLKANEKRPEIKIIRNYESLPLVKCFLGQLNQVFMNIIANAIDALDMTNEGKTFTQIESNPHQITIDTELSTENNTIFIKIKDNGPGMPKSIQKRVFDNLFTTKGVGKGTGLGLAIAKQIVEETHGGKISCNSVVGKGTEFVIELPIDEF